jgi:ATP-binding cassette, subfamily F, member 3
VAIEAATLHGYLGGWPEYVRAREERAREAAAKPAKTERPKPKRVPRPNSAKEQERLEREIEQAEATLKALEQELADPAAWSTPQRTARATARHEEARRTVDELYARWERLAG